MTPAKTQFIKVQSQERRLKCRFPVVTELEYKLCFPGRKLAVLGRGLTVNVSGKGVLFESKRSSLPVGALIELSIVWPMNLDEGVGLKLFVVGHIVRNEDSYAAVKFSRYEFRTRRLKSRKQDGPMAAGAD